MSEYLIFTDGGCWPNPGGIGGWGALIINKGTNERHEIHGGEESSTNNRMEITAAIEAVRVLCNGQHNCSRAIICTDSKYLRNGITKWIEAWKRRGWTTKEGTPVKNRELWEQLDALCVRVNVKWKWVPGHAGVSGNERADYLAGLGKKLVEQQILDAVARQAACA